MIVSDARREANRRNALKSTGPRTPEGKEQSRQNAVKHGLTSLVVVTEDPETFRTRAVGSFWSFKPQTDFQGFLADEVALLTLRIERAQRIERKARDQFALRAMTLWDDDRRLEAEKVARHLADRPAEVVAQLRQTPQGCDLLLDRWAILARMADSDPGWVGDCRRLAFDLLGTPPELRTGNPGATIDADGRPLDAGADAAAVARLQIAEIRSRREAVAEADEVARELAEADLVDEPTAEIRRLRRYEAALQRRLRWCVARLDDPIPLHPPAAHLVPRPEPAPEPEVPADVEAEPEPEPETDEESSDAPPVAGQVDAAAVHEARHRLAAAQREARRRKRRRRRA